MSDRPTEQPFPLVRSLGYQIRATHREFQSYLASRIEPHGVTLGAWYFLRVLWEQDGLTQRELSARVGTMEPTTLTALRSMERSGLITRRRNDEDGRKMNVFLTPKGRRLEDTLLPLARAVVEDAAAGLTEAERETLHDLLRRMRGNIAARRRKPAVAD